MGTMFEELLRRFNEENNVTEAGEHFTPRDYVKLLADLAVIPVADKLKTIHTRCMMVLVEQVVFLLLHKIALKKLLTKEARMFKC